MLEMTTELIITIIIAAAGWIWAIFQFFTNRRWQKKDYIQQQRYEAYKGFMGKMDSISESMRNDPTKSVFSMIKEFMASLLASITSDSFDAGTATITFTNQLLDQTQKSCEPLQQINGEINSIKLIASDELLGKLDELQALNQDLYNEMMLALKAVGKEQIPDFQELKTVGQQERWKRFESLYSEIRKIMRKEIGIQ